MTTAPALHIPRAAYALTVGLATIAGLVCAWLVARAMGGDSTAVRVALVALGIGSVATFMPVVLNLGREYWGVAVVFSGVARALIVLAVAYFWTQGKGGVTRPVFLGAVSGAGLILAVEVVAAIVILSKLERRREAAKTSTPTASTAVGV